MDKQGAGYFGFLYIPPCLAWLLDTHEKESLFTEIEELILPRDQAEYDAAVFQRGNLLERVLATSSPSFGSAVGWQDISSSSNGSWTEQCSSESSSPTACFTLHTSPSPPHVGTNHPHQPSTLSPPSPHSKLPPTPTTRCIEDPIITWSQPQSCVQPWVRT